jgi:hypothetical protein
MPENDRRDPRGGPDPFALRAAAAEAAGIRLGPPPGVYEGFAGWMGLTAGLAEGVIQPCAVPAEVGAVPEGTKASRCRSCGEIRLHYPGDTSDPWKKHFDHCDGVNEALEG